MAVTVVRAAASSNTSASSASNTRSSIDSASASDVSAPVEIDAVADAAVYNGHGSQTYDSSDKIVTFEQANVTALELAANVIQNQTLGKGAHGALTDQHARGHLAA